MTAISDDLVVQFVPSKETAWRCGYQVRGVRYIVYYADDVGWIPYPSGSEWWLPERFQVQAERVTSKTMPYAVRMDFVAQRTRPPECVELAFQKADTDITSEGLRRVSVSKLLRDAALAAVHESPEPAGWSKQPLEVGGWARLYASENPPQRSTRNRLDDAHFRRVAKVYEEARVAGTDPVRAVESHENCSRSTAGRWVGEARSRGYLAATTPGKPSEPPKRSRTRKGS